MKPSSHKELSLNHFEGGNEARRRGLEKGSIRGRRKLRAPDPAALLIEISRPFFTVSVRHPRTIANGALNYECITCPPSMLSVWPVMFFA